MMLHLKKFAMDYDGPITFVKSSQLCRFQQCSRGSIIEFNLFSSKVWKLGIVKSNFPINYPPIANLFQWTRGLTCVGVPEFVTLKKIAMIGWILLINSHFKSLTLMTLKLFLNEIQGIPI